MAPRFLIILSLLFSSLTIYPAVPSEREKLLKANLSSLKEEIDVTIPDSIVPPQLLKLQTDATAILDTIAVLNPSVEDTWWWTRLKRMDLDLTDPTVRYPKFIGFCVSVYNWAERVLNSYDSGYVKQYKQKWKIRLLNDDWIDSYLMTLPDGMKLHMFSNLYPNIGAYLHFMSFSIGYTYDMKKIAHTPPVDHKKLEFSFNCATFDVEGYYHENTGNIILGKFGNVKDHFSSKEKFPGTELYTFGLDAYYFFNHKKYSHEAAYNFSIKQRVSQGSLITGFSYCNINLSMDFAKFPEIIQNELTIPVAKYKFHYNSYALICGYGYNWVINPRLLLNFTLTPSIGFTHCYEDSLEGGRYMPSMNVSGRSSINYDLGKFFFCAILRFNGHWYKSPTYSLFSSIENFSANIGFRF